MGPISTIITLYILQLGGTVIDVSYAIALAGAVAIPAALFWGVVSDVFQRRKAQIVVAYAGLAVLLVAFALLHSVAGIVLTYGLYAFVTAASATPQNLLVMETSQKQKWARSFSRLQYMASLGSTIGFTIAVVIASLLSLKELMLALAAMAVVSSALTVLLVYQPQEKMSREGFASNLYAFMSRIFVSPVMILRVPTLSRIRRLWAKMHGSTSDYAKLAIIYEAIFVFSLGSGLFNTAYPAGLDQVGLTQSNVFLVILSGMAIQAVAFYILGKRSTDGRKLPTIVNSLSLRSASYIVIGAAFIFYSKIGALITGLIFYPIASGIAYAFYYTASNTLVFDSLKGIGRGSALGAYTALMGVGTFLGALISGYSAFYLGYWVTFVVGGILMLGSGMMFARVRRL